MSRVLPSNFPFLSGSGKTLPLCRRVLYISTLCYNILLAPPALFEKVDEIRFDQAQSPETEAAFLEGLRILPGASACCKVSKRAEASSLCCVRRCINIQLLQDLWHSVRNCAIRPKKSGSLSFPAQFPLKLPRGMRKTLARRAGVFYKFYNQRRAAASGGSCARVAELADAPGLGPGPERGAGSSPASRIATRNGTNVPRHQASVSPQIDCELSRVRKS